MSFDAIGTPKLVNSEVAMGASQNQTTNLQGMGHKSPARLQQTFLTSVF